MPDSRYFEPERLIERTDSIKRDILHCKNTLLIEVLGGTLLLILFFALINLTTSPKNEIVYILRFLPPILNCVIWFMWAYLSLKTTYRKYMVGQNEKMDRVALIGEYEAAYYLYRVYKNAERIINVFTAAQFILLALVTLFMNFNMF
jgi:hypothetical protein